MNLTRLFPEQVTNHYQGHPIAKWVFLVLTFITIARSLVHMFAPDGGAQSIATIPLDTYTAAGADTVILIFALWGLSQLLLGLLYVVVLWRYQSLIPLMYGTIIIEYAMRLVLGNLKPITTTATAPGAVANLVFPLLALIMLVLSLHSPETSNKRIANIT